MMEESRAEELEDRYGMPPGRLMYHFYHEREMSASEIADEVGVHRNTVKRWLQHAGVKMRSRTLTDVQRVLIIAYLSTGHGTGSVAQKADCGKQTVYRYRKELEDAGKPVDITTPMSPTEWALLCEIIDRDITRSSESSKSTSNCTADSD